MTPPAQHPDAPPSSWAQARAVGWMLVRGAANSLRRRQGRGALVAFPLLFAFLLLELARFGSRATDGMRAVLAVATPAKGVHYAALWLSELALALTVLKFARIIPGRGSRGLFDTALLRALPVAPGARLLVELAQASLAAVGFVLLVWVPATWGLARHTHPVGIAVGLTALSTVGVNLTASLVAMAAYALTARRLGGRALDAVRASAAVLGVGLIVAFGALGPIGAGVARRVRVTAFVPAWSPWLPLRSAVRWVLHPADGGALLGALGWLLVPAVAAMAVVLWRARVPSDLSLDAPYGLRGEGRWQARVQPWRVELRALVRQAPYLPLATPAFVAFFFLLAHGARGATGHDLPLLVLMGLMGWALVVLGTALSGALSRRWRRVLWIPTSLGVGHTDTVRAAAAAHALLTVGLSFGVFATLLGAVTPEPVWFVRMVLGVTVCVTLGQWLQASAVFLLIDPAPDRLTGLSVGALLGVLATSLPTAALVVLLSATPLAQWSALVFVLGLTAWSLERSAVARLRYLLDPAGDPDASRRTWPALRAFGLGLIAQLLAMQLVDAVRPLSPAGTLALGYVAFAAVALPLGWQATRLHARPPRWPMARSVAVGVAAGAANFVAAITYARWATRHLGGATGGPLSEAITHATPAARVSLVLCAALLGPVSEELFFRGWLQPALPHDLGPARARWSLVLTALTFAVLHSGEAWPPALFAGLVAGVLWQRSGRIATSVAMHVTNNSLAMAGALGLLDRLGVKLG